MRRLIIEMLVGFSFGLAAPGSLERVGRFEAPALVEVSGIVKSRKQPGIFWVHNDSGNPAILFAVKLDGSLVRSYRVEVPNVDWEDIATDDSGHLYLGDIGNNDNRLPLRAIYQIDEPDVSLPVTDKPLKATVSTYYKFPPDARFDAESLFVDQRKAFVISKRFDGQDAEIFSIPLSPPSPLLRPALPERVAKLPECSEPATGADLSADGQRLAVVTTRAVRVYRPDGQGGWLLVSTVRFDAPGVEAIGWDGMDLILASEDRSVYRISEKAWKEGAR